MTRGIDSTAGEWAGARSRSQDYLQNFNFGFAYHKRTIA
jgi:hypothetical protein